MRCPRCDSTDTRVIDSRPTGDAVRRRRVCSSCSHRFTTYERVEQTMAVRKRSGGREPFDAAKLRRSVASALADRPVAAGLLDDLIASIEATAAESSGEVTTEEIGRMVLEALREADEVAYLRFASVYKDFEGARDFEREMAALEED